MLTAFSTHCLQLLLLHCNCIVLYFVVRYCTVLNCILLYFIVAYFCPAPLSDFVRGPLQMLLIDGLILASAVQVKSLLKSLLLSRRRSSAEFQVDLTLLI